MPYVVTAGVSHADEFLAPGTVLSDKVGAEVLVEHSDAVLVRIAHDDDLCAKDCAHPDHPWNSASAVKPNALRYTAPSAEVIV